MKIVDTGPQIQDDDPYLPFGLRVLDARELYNNLSSGESLYVTYPNYSKSLWLSSRTFNYEVEWEDHFRLTKEEAREIVELGYARYWSTVKEEQK